MESNAEPIEQLANVVVEIPNVVDARIEIGFHDQLVMFNMEIAEHLVMDNQVAKGEDLYISDMDVVGVDSLVTDVVEDLHDIVDLCVLDVDLLVDFMFEDIILAGHD